MREQVQAIMNTKEGVANKDVEQEPDGDLSKYFLPQVPDIQINTEGDEDEQIRDEYCSRIEYACKYSSPLLCLNMTDRIE